MPGSLVRRVTPVDPSQSKIRLFKIFFLQKQEVKIALFWIFLEKIKLDYDRIMGWFIGSSEFGSAELISIHFFKTWSQLDL